MQIRHFVIGNKTDDEVPFAMMPNFTVEEKAFVQSARETVEGPLERIPCIRTNSYLMARANTPEMSMMMDRVQNKLGMMTDVEYFVYDFSVDEEETEEDSSEL